MLADLIPNKTLRQTINRILELTTSSTESDKSSVLVQGLNFNDVSSFFSESKHFFRYLGI